jgi:hypothetical protein
MPAGSALVPGEDEEPQPASTPMVARRASAAARWRDRGLGMRGDRIPRALIYASTHRPCRESRSAMSVADRGDAWGIALRGGRGEPARGSQKGVMSGRFWQL